MIKQRRKNLAGAVSKSEMRDRLERARMALSAAKRAPDTKAARALRVDLKQQIGQLEKDLDIEVQTKR